MAYKIYEGRPPALLQKRVAELLLVCFHELLRRRHGHLAVLMTTHEARRLATQNTASGNDLRCKAIHDT